MVSGDTTFGRIPDASIIGPAGFKYLVTEMVCWAAGGPQFRSGLKLYPQSKSVRK